MVNGSAGGAMVMAVEEGRMAGGTLAAAKNGGTFEFAVDGRLVTEGAAQACMNLAGADEGGGGGGVAADAIGHGRGSGGGGVDLDLSGVAVIVGIEVGGMAFEAITTRTAVDRGIAVAVCTNNQQAVGAGMAGEAGAFVDGADRIAGVAAAAEGGCPDGSVMVMAMAWVITRQDLGLGIGEVIAAVTAKAVLVLGDGFCPSPIDRILQGRRGGVAIAALVAVHRHRIIGGMAADAEGRVEDMAQAGRFGTMVDV